MDYEQFLRKVIEGLQDSFPGMDLEIQNISKLQGESYTGLSIKPEAQDVGVTMNLNGQYTDLQAGTPFEKIVDKIRDGAMQALKEIPDIDLKDLTNYEQMKHNLVMCAVPTKRNQEMLEGIPHKELEDLSIIYRIKVDHAQGSEATVLVTNTLLKTFGISSEQLIADAETYAPERRPVLFRPLGEVLSDMSGGGIEPAGKDVTEPLLASVPEMINGAGILGYPDFFSQAAEMIGGNFYILPSSIHELLLLPDGTELNAREMNEMVSSINAAQVLPEEQLSDEAYHYDAREKLFEKAYDYESRMIESQVKAFDVVAERMPAYLRGPDEPVPEMMDVLMIKPNQYPEAVRIGTDLKSLQEAVGGSIEAVFPFEDRVCLIANEEGKLEGLPLNRGLRGDNGEIYDVIAGPFLVAGLTEGDFGSLTPDQMMKFEEMFHQPEMFIKMGRGIMSLPLPDDMVERPGKAADKDNDKARAMAESKEKHSKAPVHDDR